MKLTVVEQDKRRSISVLPGQKLLAVLQREGYLISAPCGGKGTCRKCLVEIAGLGQVVACQTDLTAELLQQAGVTAGQALTVKLPQPALARISADGLIPAFVLTPQVLKGTIELPLASLQDQRPDDERFATATSLRLPQKLLGELPRRIAENGGRLTFYFHMASDGTGEVLRFIRPDSPEPLGVAVDIGTTTLAAWLYDLGDGRRLASAAAINPQHAFGADVISRIEYASGSPDNQLTLRRCLLDAIAGLARTMIGKIAADDSANAPDISDICHFVLTGNTTMLHLLTGLPADGIARSPFIAVSLQAQSMRASELELPVAGDALCQLLPGIASYVGADITAGILACRLEDPALLLDIGTNGEIVLAGPQGMLACSTAAGPAFEGANITCGMGAVSGAIDEFAWQDGKLAYSVINGEKPRGLCGSGLVAALAVLLDLQLIESTGRITDEPEGLAAGLAGRIVEYAGQPAIELVAAADCANGRPVLLTQKDIREVQNAKAAIAAGITLLLDQAGLEASQVETVFLAGGFGNAVDVQHAFRIGLLPPELAGKTRAVGNTAGMGAILCLLEADSLARAGDIARSVRYYELSADKRFVDLYVDAMFFPELPT